MEMKLSVYPDQLLPDPRFASPDETETMPHVYAKPDGGLIVGHPETGRKSTLGNHQGW